jgi:hypothetical protein
MNLKSNYEKAVNDYVKVFEEKQDCYIQYWVADRIGEICEVADCFFNFTDIKTDIDENADVGLIFEWFWSDEFQKHNINYYSYIKGLRLK